MKAPETVVTQEDRDAAADAVKAYRGQKNGDWQARIRRGEADDGEMVQAFARHRIAHRPPPLQSGEIGELVEKAKVLRLIGDAHRTQDYAGRTHGFIYNAGETVPLGAVVIAAEGCEQEVGRARLDLIVAAVNALPTLLATITALQAELASARKVAGEGENVMIVASAPLKVAMGAEWAECSHVWTLYGDGGDLGGNRTEVVCRKCQCPGDYEDHAVRVVWPTT